MRKFRFELDALLELRKSELEKEEIELSRIITERNRLDGDIESNIGEITRVNRAGKNDCDPGALFTNHLYFARLSATNRKLSEERDGCDEKAEQARAVYIEALKKVKSIEMLKERRYAEHKRERIKSETALFDEMGAGRKTLI